MEGEEGALDRLANRADSAKSCPYSDLDSDQGVPFNHRRPVLSTQVEGGTQVGCFATDGDDVFPPPDGKAGVVAPEKLGRYFERRDRRRAGAEDAEHLFKLALSQRQTDRPKRRRLGRTGVLRKGLQHPTMMCLISFLSLRCWALRSHCCFGWKCCHRRSNSC